MSKRDPIYDAMKEISREKFNADRDRFMAEAQAADDGGWIKHTEHHWSRMLNGERLDYWPSRRKFQFRGKVRRGDVLELIRKEEPTA
jgi:hypothetical protein